MKLDYILRKSVYYLINRPVLLKEPALERVIPSIPGWLDPGHLYCFDYAIKNLPDTKPIIEIGTFAGLSTNVILYYLNKYGKTNQLYSTDWFLRDIEPNESIALLKDPLELSGYLKELFVRNVRFFSPNSNNAAFDLASDDFFNYWKQGQAQTDLFGNQVVPGTKISFAYIDGNHKYEFAKRDFDNVDKILIKGGYILFDDSAGYTKWGSRDVAIEAVKSGKYKVIKKNPHYFVQKIEGE